MIRFTHIMGLQNRDWRKIGQLILSIFILPDTVDTIIAAIIAAKLWTVVHVVMAWVDLANHVILWLFKGKK